MPFLIKNEINKWIAVDDKSARGGNSEMSFEFSEAQSVLFKAHLVPIKGNDDQPVGFALAKTEAEFEIEPESELTIKPSLKGVASSTESLSFKVFADQSFILSVALIVKTGAKYQVDVALRAGQNDLSLQREDFVLSKWGASLGEELESFKEVLFFEHGVLFSRQGISEFRDFKASWSLTF